MTLSEFKSWFDGFTEQLKSAPNEKQWARIKARVKEIDGTEITKTIYLDRYWNYPTPYWQHPWSYAGASGGIGIGAGAGGSLYSSGQMFQNQNGTGVENWNSNVAMCALGAADYQNA